MNLRVMSRPWSTLSLLVGLGLTACQQTEAPSAPAAATSKYNAKFTQDSGAGGGSILGYTQISSNTGESAASAGALGRVAVPVGSSQSSAANVNYLPSATAGTSVVGKSNSAGSVATMKYGSIGGSCPSSANWVYPATLPAANLSLWQFARGSLGQIVGDGQCTELVVQWQNSTQKTQTNLGTTDGAQDYIWGTLVATVSSTTDSVAAVLPGDIVQFKNVQLQLTDSSNSYMTISATHHTAIVSAVSPSDNALCLLEQNSSSAASDSYGYVPVSALQSGVMHIYRYQNP